MTVAGDGYEFVTIGWRLATGAEVPHRFGSTREDLRYVTGAHEPKPPRK
ncbi:MAG TPA: hypothetical protein VLT61_03940 [Anaeromyxobacteraceae bacterium]|nr:hypothetical protein [Anaeromyxobacteraceae bacterium]